MVSTLNCPETTSEDRSDQRPKVQGQFEEEADEVLKLFEERLSQARAEGILW